MAKSTSSFRVVLMGVNHAGAFVWSAREGCTGHMSWSELEKETSPAMVALRQTALADLKLLVAEDLAEVAS
jgi:hypothetical protein